MVCGVVRWGRGGKFVGETGRGREVMGWVEGVDLYGAWD